MYKYITPILLIASTIIYSSAAGQSDLPIKDGKIFYEIVDSVQGSATDLYNKSKLWFVEAFKSANAVIQLDDKENSTIIGKGYFSFTHNLQPYEVWFTAKINVKDNRYRAQLYGVNVRAGSTRVELAGEWFIERKARGKEREKMANGFEDIIEHLKKFMAKKSDNDF